MLNCIIFLNDVKIIFKKLFSTTIYKDNPIWLELYLSGLHIFCTALSAHTWSACPCSRSTCLYAAAGCWGWRRRWCRTAAWPPVWWALGRFRADTWWSGMSWAVGWWSPTCMSLHQRYWTSSYGDPWASPQTHPGWFHAPACQRLQRATDGGINIQEERNRWIERHP